MPSGDNVTYVSGTGHRPVPHADDLLYRQPHTPRSPKPTGLDWAALTRACSGCSEKSTELVTGLCPTCRGITPAKTKGPVIKASTAGDTYGDNELAPEDLDDLFTAPTRRTLTNDLADLEATDPDVAAAAAALDRVTDRITHPDDHVIPAHLEPRKEPTPVSRHAFPPYIVDVAVVMRDSENHPDPAVRAARKTVANALVGLNKELLRYGDAASRPKPSPPRKHGPPGPRAARYSGHVRIKELGTTAREIREWARSRNITVPTHGTLPLAVIEAYATTHNTPTGATA